jgi:hypothetical protein
MLAPHVIALPNGPTMRRTGPGFVVRSIAWYFVTWDGCGFPEGYGSQRT